MLLAEDASVSKISWDGREFFAEVSSLIRLLGDQYKTHTREWFLG